MNLIVIFPLLVACTVDESARCTGTSHDFVSRRSLKCGVKCDVAPESSKKSLNVVKDCVVVSAIAMNSVHIIPGFLVRGENTTSKCLVFFYKAEYFPSKTVSDSTRALAQVQFRPLFKLLGTKAKLLSTRALVFFYQGLIPWIVSVGIVQVI